MKKVLILTVTAGNGHNACANAMKEKLEKMGDVQVEVVDLLKQFSTSNYVWAADKGYNLAVGHLRGIYNLFYEHYKRAKPEKRYRCRAQGTVLSVLPSLYKLINTFQPDVIYSTHFYGAIAITNLRLVYEVPCKAIVSSLDYVNSPFWEAAIGVDYFNIANEDFIPECIEEGFQESQLKPLGLPIDEKFYFSKSKAEARKELELNPDLFTVMILFGGGHWSGGYKLFKDLVQGIHFPVQVLMINGRDKVGYQKVQKLKQNLPDHIQVFNVGFTKQVDLYMAATDCIIGKLGGTSATEIINSGTPYIATEKLPAQEKYNLNYLKSKGILVSFKNKDELHQIINELHDTPGKLEEMASAVKKLRTNGIDNVAKLILSQPKATYNDTYIAEIKYTEVINRVKKQLKTQDKIERKKAKVKRKRG